MDRRTLDTAAAWGRASHGYLVAPQLQASGNSSCSSTSAPVAGQSALSSISMIKVVLCSKPLEWYVESATPRSWLSLSRRWIGRAHRARSGKRPGFQGGQFHSTCTMFRWFAATVASEGRCQSASSWTLHAAIAGHARWSCMIFGQRTVMKSGCTAASAATIGALLRSCLRRKGTMSRQATSSLHVTSARTLRACMPRICSEARGWHAAHNAAGSAIPRSCPESRMALRLLRPLQALVPALRLRRLPVSALRLSCLPVFLPTAVMLPALSGCWITADHLRACPACRMASSSCRIRAGHRRQSNKVKGQLSATGRNRVSREFFQTLHVTSTT